MKLYVYCLVEGKNELLHSLQGIAGAPVRLLTRDMFSLSVSDFAGDAVAVTRENVLAHAAVVQSLLERTTPLPVRFGTIVTEEQLESYVSAKHEALRAKLEQVRGCVEMSVKIIWDREWAEEPATNIGQQKPGTAFLSEKRREILGGEARAEEAKRVAEWLEDQIREIVREMEIKTNPIGTNATSKSILAAAHLVERDRLDEFRLRVAEARQQRPELHFLVSGPWAPYSFSNIDLEFKTHFGVS
jgi:Gas vesicle synthesis protein GvpL/GvpF